jgi:hypothetical protein
MNRISVVLRPLAALLLPAALFAVLAMPASALAGEPATVTVRVEGFSGTLLPQTQVTTSTTPVPVEGGTCSGTSAGGALYDAVKGNWRAVKGSFGVEILGIDGVDLPPFGEENYAYWSIWVNNSFASKGACEEELQTGADIVFAAQCFATGPYCPSDASAPEHFLTSSPPSASVVGINEAVTLKIGSLSTASGAAEAELPAETTVGGDPSGAVTPQHDGTATLTFSAPGVYTVQAHAPGSVPSDPQTVCVHNGNDGLCGTSAPGGQVAGFHETAPYKGPFALVAHAGAPLDGHVYSRRHSVRQLSGTIVGHSAISAVRIELRRGFHGRCSTFDGARAKFVPARCGGGTPFQVASGPSWSYLLPAALPRGRYVLDVLATDVAGNQTSLARGSSRVVFYVR